jgi:putative hydrolase of the HAD superfamily
MGLKALMVDVDGVLVHPKRGGHWSDGMEAELGLSRAALDQHFFAAHWEDVMLGRADLHERLAPVLAKIALHLTSARLADYWFAADGRLDEDLLADLAELRAEGLVLHLATVQEHHRARYLWETLELRQGFDAMHYAADLGCAKPDPAFYAAIEARTGYAAHELALLDDRPANVAAAQARGWGGVLWDGGRPIRDLLAALRTS